MTNNNIVKELKGISLSSYNAKWKTSPNYKLNLDARKKHSYSVLYLVDEQQGECDNSNHSNNSKNFKYAMFVYDESNDSDTELYIVIGQNPSYSSKRNVDRTNQSIYKAIIHNKKSRYLLLNTFPKIDSDGINSPDSDKCTENMEIVKAIINHLNACQLTIKVVYACGGSLPVYAKFIEEIKELIKEKEIETYAFEAKGEVQMHMSMQNINSKQLKPSDFSIVKYDIDFASTDGFKHVKFIKGEHQ